jgi:hypothetical protein
VHLLHYIAVMDRYSSFASPDRDRAEREPLTTLKTPRGDSLRARIRAGLPSQANSTYWLTTTVQPAASAQVVLRQMNNAFESQAVINPATPTGKRETVVLRHVRRSSNS